MANTSVGDLGQGGSVSSVTKLSQPFGNVKLEDTSCVSSPTGQLYGNHNTWDALTPDGTTGVIYLPIRATITVNLARMSGKVVARWFSPTDGKPTYIGRFANSGKRDFTSPGAHSDGFDDWVLLLRTSS